MIIKMLAILFSLALDLLAIFKMTDSDKDLEIIILRQQVRILQRKVKTTPRITDPERMVLATLTDKFKQAKTGVRQRFDQVIMIFKPETVLRWHRELVRRKWTYKQKGKPVRPKITDELEALIVRLAKENTRWGYERIQGELLKLGYTLCPSTVGNVLKRQSFPRSIGDGITPACERSSSSWRKFLGHYKEQMLACDFFRRRDLSFPRFFGDRSQNHLHPVLHRTGHPARPFGRLHHAPQHHLGYPTSTSADLGSGGRTSTASLSHPGQRQEISHSLRHRLHFTRHRDCDDPVSSPSGKCFRRALGALCSPRMPRSYLESFPLGDRERASSAPRSSGVRRILQPGSPSSGHLSANSYFRSGAQHRGANSQARRAWGHSP